MHRPFTIHRTFKQRDECLPLHAHAEGQLTFAASGMVQIHADRGIWLVPPQLASWIPTGVEHRVEVLTDAEFWMVHCRLETLLEPGDQRLDEPFVLRITPLLRALLDEAVAIPPKSEKADLVVRLMLHELTAMPDAPTFLPLPASAAGRRVADLALADQRNELSLDELASRAAMSARAISRLFPAETGMTLKAWRQRARIVRAIEQLGHGDPPAKVARDSGFASTAAFSCAFRQVTATTPTTFVQVGR